MVLCQTWDINDKLDIRFSTKITLGHLYLLFEVMSNPINFFLRPEGTSIVNEIAIAIKVRY